MFDEILYFFGDFFVILLCLIGAFFLLWLIGKVFGKRISKAYEKVSNPQFNGDYQTRLDSSNGQIILCSATYPNPDGSVWIASQDSITIIDRESNRVVPFHKISSMELREMSNGGILKILSPSLVPYAVGELTLSKTEIVSQGGIIFLKHDLFIAQAICDRISEAT